MRKFAAVLFAGVLLFADVFGPLPGKGSRRKPTKMTSTAGVKVRLLGIVQFPGKAYAIVKIGEKVVSLSQGRKGRYRLVKVLSPTSAIVAVGRRTYVLKIKKRKGGVR